MVTQNKLAQKFIEAYKSEEDISRRMEILSEFVNIYYDSEMSLVEEMLRKEMEVCIATKFLDGEALVRFMLAYSSIEGGKIELGMQQIGVVLGFFERVTNPQVRGQIHNFLAFMHSHQGNFEKAFYHAYECVKEGDRVPNDRNRYWGTYTLGVLHFDLKDYVNSEKCYSQAAERFGMAGNDYGRARSETGLASVYIRLERFREAGELLERSLNYYREIGVSSGLSRSLNDLGLICRKTGEFEKALSCFREALKVRRDTNHVQGIATTLNDISDLLVEMKKYNEALPYLEEAKAVCERVGNKAKLYRTHFLFSMVYRNINEPWKALEHYELYDKLKTEVTGETANNRITEMQKKMAAEKSEKEAEIERLKNVELANANHIISERNKEILDSIRYAKRIQLSLLPTEKFMERALARLREQHKSSV
jgi:tetratricopeptide (TPR) repeat protein